MERAVEYVLGHAALDYHSRSDFGYAFARFCRESLERLDRKTTLLILGDARNNCECRTLAQLAEVVDGLVQGWWRRRGAVR